MYRHESEFERWIGDRYLCYNFLTVILSALIIWRVAATIQPTALDEILAAGFTLMLCWVFFYVVIVCFFYAVEYATFKCWTHYKGER